MADMLAEQARRRLKAEGAPISEQNLKWAIEELRLNPSLQEGASSQNDMIAKFGGSTGKPDRSGKGSGGFGVHDPDYEAPNRPNSDVEGDRYYSSPSQMTSGPAQGQGGNAKGASPGNLNKSVSTQTIKETNLAPPKAQPLDPVAQTSAEVNAVHNARPTPVPRVKPTSMGAGPEPQPARPSPPSQADIVGPPLQAPELGPINMNPSPTVPAPLVAGGGVNPLAAASGVPPGLDTEPAGPSWESLLGMFPGGAEGVAGRAKNVLGYGAAIGAPLLAAFAAMKGGRAPLAQPAGQMRPPAAGVAGARPAPIPGPPAFLQGQAPTAGLPPVMKPVTAQGPAQLAAPAVDDIGVWGSRRLSDYDPAAIGQPTTAPVAAGPVQSVPPPVITPAAPPPQLALPAPAPNPVTAVMNQAAQAAPKTRSFGSGQAAAPRAAGTGRAGTARLPPTPGKGMTLEDARATSGGGKPQPKKSGRARAKGNQ